VEDLLFNLAIGKVNSTVFKWLQVKSYEFGGQTKLQVRESPYKVVVGTFHQATSSHPSNFILEASFVDDFVQVTKGVPSPSPKYSFMWGNTGY
jgi:hypothetical protein